MCLFSLCDKFNIPVFGCQIWVMLSHRLFAICRLKVVVEEKEEGAGLVGPQYPVKISAPFTVHDTEIYQQKYVVCNTASVSFRS